jgi:hypothetical protein
MVNRLNKWRVCNFKDKKPTITIHPKKHQENNKEWFEFRCSVTHVARSDLLSEPDPFIGVLFKNERNHWIPYARTEYAINQTRYFFKRRFVVPLDDPKREIAFVLYDHDAHYGVEEKVDEFNDLDITGRIVDRARCYQLRQLFGSDIKRRHSWCGVLFESTDDHTFPALDKLNIVMFWEFSVLMLTGFIFGSESDDEMQQLAKDMFTSLLVALTLIPIAIVFAFVIRKTGSPTPWQDMMTFDVWQAYIEHAIEDAENHLPKWVYEKNFDNFQKQAALHAKKNKHLADVPAKSTPNTSKFAAKFGGKLKLGPKGAKPDGHKKLKLSVGNKKPGGVKEKKKLNLHSKDKKLVVKAKEEKAKISLTPNKPKLAPVAGGPQLSLASMAKLKGMAKKKKTKLRVVLKKSNKVVTPSEPKPKPTEEQKQATTEEQEQAPPPAAAPPPDAAPTASVTEQPRTNELDEDMEYDLAYSDSSEDDSQSSDEGFMHAMFGFKEVTHTSLWKTKVQAHFKEDKKPSFADIVKMKIKATNWQSRYERKKYDTRYATVRGYM